MLEMVARLRLARSVTTIAGLVIAAAIGIRVDHLSGFGSSSATEAAEPTDASPADDPANPSPVDLVLTADEQRAVTVNQQSDSLALVDLTTGVVLSEAACGNRPSHLALTPDGGSVLATAADS